MSQLLFLCPPRRSQHRAADAVALAPRKLVFCTSVLSLSFLFLSFFIGQLITFLHFYQKTSISGIWLRRLRLHRRHCVSSVKQAALTAAATVGWRRGSVACQHLSSSRRGFYLGALLNIQRNIYPDAPHVDVNISGSKLGSEGTSLLHT